MNDPTTERQPDTVTFTFETTVDYVVDLRTGEVKRGEVGELADEFHYVALFCEGEFAGEMHVVHRSHDGLEDGDEALIDRAADLLHAAFEAGTVKGDEEPGHPEPPEHLADAWRRYQAGEDVEPYELRRLDEWRADAREDALGW